AGLEKDTARREVLRFLTTVPGVSLDQADVIATAFPDMASLGAADAKALTQCKGVTGALARAIRLELAPGQVEQEQRATRLREEAQGFIEEGEYRAALDCYDRLLRERPEDVAVWFDRAELLVLLDRPEEALQCYTRIVDVDRGNRQAWYERANLLFGLGRVADAVPALREALRLEPSKSGEVVQKAEQLRRDRHPNEAVSLFQAVLEVAPDDPRATLGLGDAFLDLGDSEAAEVLFTRALGKNPQNAPILHRKGALLDQKGRWGAAIQYYNRAIALQWNFPDPWLAKGRILLTHDHPKEALECFEKVAAFDPKRIAAWAGQARAQAALGNAREAKAALAKATELGPDDPTVREARDSLAVPGSETQPGPPSHEDIPDLSSLAKAFEAIEDESEPTPTSTSADFQSFVESIEPDREDAQVLLQLAELALEGGDPQMALLRYEQVLEKAPRNADAWTGRGVALQHLERYREALEAYDRALSFKPDHEVAQKWRATCVRHLKREAGD
ncbi:MAG: tetratricopeptide repeat protein, partial [Methanobacteriota archaeon]